MTPEQKEAPTGWRYEIQHGPEGEAGYAWLYEGKRMVATMRTEDAIRICVAIAARHRLPGADTGQAVAWRWKPKGSSTWIYDPDPEWLAAQRDEHVDRERLYTANASLDAGEIAVKLQEADRHIDIQTARYYVDAVLKLIPAAPAVDTGQFIAGWEGRYKSGEWAGLSHRKPAGRDSLFDFIPLTYVAASQSKTDARLASFNTEKFDDFSPDEEIGAFGGSGQWVKLCTVAELRTHPAPLDAERSAIEARAREIAGHYPQSSDGRNTFVMFADWIAARSQKESSNV